jgi:hypothetical protein
MNGRREFADAGSPLTINSAYRSRSPGWDNGYAKYLAIVAGSQSQQTKESSHAALTVNR